MYTITVTALGFKKLVSTDVKLTVGQNYNLVDRATDKFCQNRCIRGVVGGTARGKAGASGSLLAGVARGSPGGDVAVSQTEQVIS
jgi:hypothetical protein